MAVDGELPARKAERAEAHLKSCWECRTRRQQMETAIGEFIRFQRGSFDQRVPAADGPRALLKAQLDRLGEQETPPAGWWRAIGRRLTWAAAAVVVLAAAGAMVFRPFTPQPSGRMVAVTVPNPAFTPGAMVLADQRQVCLESGVKNKAVPTALQEESLPNTVFPRSNPALTKSIT